MAHSAHVLAFRQAIACVSTGHSLCFDRPKPPVEPIPFDSDSLDPVLYMPSHPQRPRQHLYRPSVGRPLNLLHRAKPNSVDADSKRRLRKIVAVCRACQIHGPKPTILQLRFAGNVIFNQLVQIYVCWFNVRAVLHMLDTGTRFSSARILPREDPATMELTFVSCWSVLYIGHLENLY